MNKLIQRSFLNALGTSAYVAIVATVMQNGERIFGEMNNTDINKIIGPITFLLLFIVSASITGGLVLGKPILLYLDNQKNDAVKLFIYTVCWLAFIIAILLLVSNIKS